MTYRGNGAWTCFDHGVMGINWGGKRDYATWFSPEPSAILGIQLIPMSPSSGYLDGDADRISANVEEAGSGPLGDYALMYAGLAGTAEAERAAVPRPRPVRRRHRPGQLTQLSPGLPHVARDVRLSELWPTV